MSNTVRYNAITIFTENQGFFRQINDFTKEVTNELISRKFFQRVSAFHSAAWKNEKFTLTEKKFRQFNYLVISVVTFTKFLPKMLRKSKFP